MHQPDGDSRLLASVTLSVAAFAVLFHLFTAGFSPLTALIQRPVHLGLMATLGFVVLVVVTPAFEGRYENPDGTYRRMVI